MDKTILKKLTPGGNLVEPENPTHSGAGPMDSREGGSNITEVQGGVGKGRE